MMRGSERRPPRRARIRRDGRGDMRGDALVADPVPEHCNTGSDDMSEPGTGRLDVVGMTFSVDRAGWQRRQPRDFPNLPAARERRNPANPLRSP